MSEPKVSEKVPGFVREIRKDLIEKLHAADIPSEVDEAIEQAILAAIAQYQQQPGVVMLTREQLERLCQPRCMLCCAESFETHLAQCWIGNALKRFEVK